MLRVADTGSSMLPARIPGRTLEEARIGGAAAVSFVLVLQFRSIQGDLLFPSFIGIISADGTQTYSNKSASN